MQFYGSFNLLKVFTKIKGVKGIENNGVVFKDVKFFDYYIQ